MTISDFDAGMACIAEIWHFGDIKAVITSRIMSPDPEPGKIKVENKPWTCWVTLDQIVLPGNC